MIPLRFQASCDACGDAIDTRQPGVGQLETGYVVNRREGGANSVRLMKRQPSWRCKLCLEKEARGQATFQMGLFT